jgi:hypothetical protein
MLARSGSRPASGDACVQHVQTGARPGAGIAAVHGVSFRDPAARVDLGADVAVGEGEGRVGELERHSSFTPQDLVTSAPMRRAPLKEKVA